mmetsp:Transcript_5629/g.17096  ORF Transcript_5629/g.17096 Transcript_5629/m.17096 type:complete len:252 (+) Transcript_5629:256-1011(+)
MRRMTRLAWPCTSTSVGACDSSPATRLTCATCSRMYGRSTKNKYGRMHTSSRTSAMICSVMSDSYSELTWSLNSCALQRSPSYRSRVPTWYSASKRAESYAISALSSAASSPSSLSTRCSMASSPRRVGSYHGELGGWQSAGSYAKHAVDEKNASENAGSTNAAEGVACRNLSAACVAASPPNMSALYSPVRLPTPAASTAFHASFSASDAAVTSIVADRRTWLKRESTRWTMLRDVSGSLRLVARAIMSA